MEPSRITHVGLDVKMKAEEEESREFALCVAWVEPYREPARACAGRRCVAKKRYS